MDNNDPKSLDIAYKLKLEEIVKIDACSFPDEDCIEYYIKPYEGEL